MAVSKKLRFEIFKRDSFACQYCGRTPPAVVLECDHVTAVANGGTDEEHNLITSCFDCNRGKSDTPLNTMLPTVSERAVRGLEIAEQLDSYNRLLMELRDRQDKDIDDLGRIWFNHFKKKKDNWTFGPARVRSIRSFLKKLTKAELLDAVDIAHGKVSVKGDDDDQAFRYFCGVCWGMIKDRDGGHQ